MGRVLVYGWYGKGNVGDELMAQALKRLLEPRGLEVEVVGQLNYQNTQNCDGIIFGGGSILYGEPIIDKEAWDRILNEIPIFYVGVGLETEVHPRHRVLMNASRGVFTRSQGRDMGSNFKASVISLPDLVYSLPAAPKSSPGRGLLVVPNIEVLPTHEDPHWKHVAWEKFKDEFAQFLDVAIEDLKLRPTFLLFCKNDRMDDRWPAHELIGRMKKRSTQFNIVQAPSDSMLVTGMIDEFKVVVTQRYHGIILAQMAGVPHVSVDHHDKLKEAWPRRGISLPYYGIVKANLVDACKAAAAAPREQLVVPPEAYAQAFDAIAGIIKQERENRGKQVRGGT